MSRDITLVAILIGLLIVVAYWVGTTNILKTFFGSVTPFVTALQGRTKSGTFSPYPGNAGG